MPSRSTCVPSKPRQRSAVTNGKRAFVIGDGNSPWARRWRDLTAIYVSDLGGVDVLSEAEIGMCRRAAALSCECEQMDGQLSLGQPIDLDLYARITSALRRVHEALGLKRVAKTVNSNPLADHFSRPPERRAAS